jgi:hypothetical protein
VNGLVGEFAQIKRRLNDLERPKAVVSASVVETPRVKTGYYYSYLGVDMGGNTFHLATLNTLFLQPFFLGASATATRIAVNVSTPVTGGVMRLGIYSNSATEDYPSALLLDCGSVSTATGGSKTITINQPLSQGLYWIGFLSTTGSPQLWGFQGWNGTGSGGASLPNTQMMPSFTTASFSGLANAYAWTQTGQTSFPATFAGTGLVYSSCGSMWLGF